MAIAKPEDLLCWQRLIVHATLLERRDSVLGVFAFTTLGTTCCSGDSKNASL
jgi:hypothetical protein